MTKEPIADRVAAGLERRRDGMARVVADYLIERIVVGELPAGSHLVEANLAAELGVSKTPVREALRILPETGLVEVIPFRGAFVREVTPRFVNEVNSLRCRLESFATELALPHLTEEDFESLRDVADEMERHTEAGDHLHAARLDVRFHSILYERSGHELLIELWERLVPRVERLQAYGRIVSSPLPAGHVAKRHRLLIDALSRASVDEAVEAVVEHIQTGERMALTGDNFSK